MRRRAAFILVSVVLASSLSAAQASAFFLFNKKKEAARQTSPAPTPPQDSTPPLTLGEAYRLALKRSETLAIEGTDLDSARARFYGSFKYFLPSVSFTTSRFERDVDDDGGASGEGVSGDARRRVTPEDKFVFSQPLFSGFKEIAALQASGADRGQQRLEYQRAAELLFIDVMESYYAVLEASRRVETYRSIQKLLNDRMKELEERVALGRSRQVELKTALADLRLLESDLAEAESSLVVANNLLEFYTGTPVRGRPLLDSPVPADVPLDAEKAALERSDVQAAQQGLRVARAGVLSAQAGFLPSASLDGNYYTRRVGFQEGTDWDYTVKAEVPLFDGAQTWSEVKDAQVKRKRAELTLELAQRAAKLEIADAYESLTAAGRIEEALQAARDASRESYDLLTEEYRLSLVNNLQVLDALRRYEEVHLRHDAAHLDVRREYWRFKTAVGEVRPELAEFLA